MSRSYKHKPISGNTCAESEKKDKQKCNRKTRRLAKMLLVKCPEGFIMPLKDEVLDKWLMAKDGKEYFNSNNFPRLMRK